MSLQMTLLKDEAPQQAQWRNRDTADKVLLHCFPSAELVFPDRKNLAHLCLRKKAQKEQNELS